MKDNQHFITKAHLDKFVHPTSKDNVLYPYVKEGVGPRSIEGHEVFLGSADQFYVQDDSGVTTNKLDEARKRVRISTSRAAVHRAALLEVHQ